MNEQYNEDQDQESIRCSCCLIAIFISLFKKVFNANAKKNNNREIPSDKKCFQQKGEEESEGAFVLAEAVARTSQWLVTHVCLASATGIG